MMYSSGSALVFVIIYNDIDLNIRNLVTTLMYVFNVKVYVNFYVPH